MDQDQNQGKKEFGGPQYPADWSEFVGQTQAVRQLQISARSANARGVRMPHTLLSSPFPGVGKSSLAWLTTRELGRNFRVQSGEIKKELIPYIFVDMEDGDVLFIDEIHLLGKNTGWLLLFMQDQMAQGPFGLEQAPDVTIIGATTDAGKLPQPALHRFMVNPKLDAYNDAEGALIAMQLARKTLGSAKLPLPTEQVAAAIAVASNNSPRHMLRVLQALVDLSWAQAVDPTGGKYDLAEAFEFAGVTADGLSAGAQRYLLSLKNDFRGNPAGERPLVKQVGAQGAEMTEIEQCLLSKELIVLTPRGRALTPAGMKRARQLDAA